MKKQKTVFSIIGARPQFIKIAPLTLALRGHFRHRIIHTGQHYDRMMSDNFFTELNIPQPDFHLHIGSGTHGAQTGAMLVALEIVLQKERPDLVIVYGDTNSTLAGALAAAKLQIPVAHVEAGMRSFNRSMPEEINRIVADHVASLQLCATQSAVQLLQKEGIRNNVVNVGDLMQDAVLRFLPKTQRAHQILRAYSLIKRKYDLLTIHRASNTDDPEKLHMILTGIATSPVPVLFPVHPRTQRMLQKQRTLIKNSSIRILPPLPYRAMLTLTQFARYVVTDSGGLQKEAYILKTPCITLREETEWRETLRGKWNVLVGTDTQRINKALRGRHVTGSIKPVFGKGNAAEHTVSAIERFLRAL